MSKLILLDRVDSTNTYARDNFARLPDGSVIIAREQSAGRGRMGRTWFTAPDRALAATLILKNVDAGFHAGAVAGLAALAAIRDFQPENGAYFKWPNDIYIREKKLAGILSEGVISQGRLAGVACGIGLNIAQSEEELAEIGAPATSLAVCGLKELSAAEFRERFFYHTQLYYQQYRKDKAAVLLAWRQENRLAGAPLTAVKPDGETVCGTFVEIAADGAMIMETAGGRCRFDCGDIRIDPSVIDFDALEKSITSR